MKNCHSVLFMSLSDGFDFTGFNKINNIRLQSLLPNGKEHLQFPFPGSVS